VTEHPLCDETGGQWRAARGRGSEVAAQPSGARPAACSVTLADAESAHRRAMVLSRLAAYLPGVVGPMRGGPQPGTSGWALSTDHTKYETPSPTMRTAVCGDQKRGAKRLRGVATPGRPWTILRPGGRARMWCGGTQATQDGLGRWGLLNFEKRGGPEPHAERYLLPWVANSLVVADAGGGLTAQR